MTNNQKNFYIIFGTLFLPMFLFAIFVFEGLKIQLLFNMTSVWLILFTQTLVALAGIVSYFYFYKHFIVPRL